jgi:CubicO group peptidase (beta-lactamase class C family)
MAKYFIVILVALSFPFFINAQTTAKKIDSVIRAQYTINTFNGNVEVIRKGRVLYKNSFGKADFQKNTTLNLNSVFYLGSMSKQFTAMCIMILKSRGLLQYDDNVKKYIAEFPFQNITIRHLLTHSSGINDYINLDSAQWQKYPKAMDKDISNILKERFDTLKFQPGSSFLYSNSNYAILVQIIEIISGMTYSQFISKNVFQPLKMQQSFIKTDKNVSKKAVVGYIKNDSTKMYELPDTLNSLFGSPTFKIIGGGGVFSSVGDLYKWDQALYTEKLVPNAILKEAFTPYTFVNGTKSKYGFGWNIYYRDNGDTVMRHAGQFIGYLSLITRNVTRKEAIILLTNFTGEGDINNLVSLMTQIESILENNKN